MNINLELYKIFYHVALNGSFTRAANELMISQPAISRSIKTLEEQLNITLFVRNHDGITLSKAGKKIFEKVKIAMKQIESIDDDINELEEKYNFTVSIGTTNNIAKNKCIPNFLCSFTSSCSFGLFINSNTKNTNVVRKYINVLFVPNDINVPINVNTYTKPIGIRLLNIAAKKLIAKGLILSIIFSLLKPTIEIINDII